MHQTISKNMKNRAASRMVAKDVVSKKCTNVTAVNCSTAQLVMLEDSEDDRS